MLLRVPRKCFHTSIAHNYRVAIVGAGPAGFYTAHHLLRKGNDIPLSVDFFDRLPAPYGLSRYGVAPDHPEVKNCEEYMDNLMSDFPGKVRFFGNVNIGQDLSLRSLQEHYHSIVLAYGCTASDRTLDIPGSDIPGVISARQFVNWYNGHPDSAGGSAVPDLENVESVTIVGNGNVAIDVARVLLADPKAHWDPTDMTAAAVAMLRKSSVKHVNIVARRGLLQSAFTNKEIRELVEVSASSNVQMTPISEEMLAPLRANAKSLPRVEKRKFTILDKASVAAASKPLHSPDKTWSLHFLLSPREFVAGSENPQLLSKTVFEKNDLVEDSLTNTSTAHATGESVELKNDLVILSIGYKGTPIKGFEEEGIMFSDKNNCIANNQGRVLAHATPGHQPGLTYKHGWYVSGWIKHGPRGVIATTMMESFDTAEQILEDLSNGVHNEATKDSDIAESLHSGSVSWEGWRKINEHELKEGKHQNKTRNKLQTIEEMVQIANS